MIGRGDVAKELTADLLGDYVFTDAAFANQLYKTDRNAFGRVFDKIKHLYKLATAGSREARQLEIAKYNFEQAYKSAGKVEAKSDGNEIYSRSYLNENNSKAEEKSSKHLENYSKKQYNDFGWVRYNDVVSPGYWRDFTSKFAGAKSNQQKFYKTPSGEFIIPANDLSAEGIDDVLFYAKGSIESPKVSKVVKINLNDETLIDVVREEIYESKGNFDETLADGLLEVYKAESFPWVLTEQSKDNGGISGIRRDGLGRGVSEQIRADGGEPSVSEARLSSSAKNLDPESDGGVKYSLREEAPPTKTEEVYKLMRLKDGKIYPLFIDSTESLEVGQWYNADSPNLDFLKEMPSGVFLVDPATETYQSFDEYLSESGERKTKYPSKKAIEQATADGKRWVYIEDTAKGQKRFGGETRKYWNLGINGSGTVSTFSMRPGYHAGSLPTMRQIGKGKDRNLRDDSFVWTVGEVPADINYQAEADMNPDKDIPTHIPKDGYYMKATNADKTKSQADRVGWYVSGAYKINRIISDSEARQVIDNWNKEHPDTPVEYDYDRESGMDFDAEQMKLVPRSDVKHSLSDSEGRQLTQEQAEYFRDSVVRDENGNLKPMYHGTSRGGFTVFDSYGGKHGLFGLGSYFTDSKAIGESYTKKGKGTDPQVYEAYLNIKNPIDMDAEADAAAWRKAMPDVDFPENGTNEAFYRAMEEYYEDNEYPRWEAEEEARLTLEGMGYDGITHIGGGVHPCATGWGKVTFSQKKHRGGSGAEIKKLSARKAAWRISNFIKSRQSRGCNQCEALYVIHTKCGM